ncbi:MAG: hypothetical protein PHS57_07865 [Alphaproteobacteria bacterium]|nr:hypothetical protein [Alphaproteobacteria bacterium]
MNKARPWLLYPGKNVAASAVLGLFTLTLFIGMAGLFSKGPEPDPLLARSEEAPLGILLSTPPPTLNEEEPRSVTAPVAQKVPAIFDVRVSEIDAAKAAQRFLRQGRLKTALFYQRRALERDPKNMKHRLVLATLHDRLADHQGALVLYKQVLDAFARHDKTLSRNVDIRSVEERYAYLIAAGK